MTKKEAIEYNKNLKLYMKISDKTSPYKFLEENYIALDMAIKALEQEHCEDTISRKAAIESMYAMHMHGKEGVLSDIENLHGSKVCFSETIADAVEKLEDLPSATPTRPKNQVHLCDSCAYNYPDCDSKVTDLIFENGKGNDNICACSKYTSARPKGKWKEHKHAEEYNEMLISNYECSCCGMWARERFNYCPNCGADMRQEVKL